MLLKEVILGKKQKIKLQFLSFGLILATGVQQQSASVGNTNGKRLELS